MRVRSIIGIRTRPLVRRNKLHHRDSSYFSSHMIPLTPSNNSSSTKHLKLRSRITLLNHNKVRRGVIVRPSLVLHDKEHIPSSRLLRFTLSLQRMFRYQVTHRLRRDNTHSRRTR